MKKVSCVSLSKKREEIKRVRKRAEEILKRRREEWSKDDWINVGNAIIYEFIYNRKDFDEIMKEFNIDILILI